MAIDASTTGGDWASRPSALFAAAVLGVASIATMGVSLSRDLRSDPSPIIASQHTNDNLMVATPPKPSAVRLIDMNTAPLSELDLLPGIGPALGQRIIDHRDEHGPFNRIEDITQVSGIGPRTLDKMRTLITLGQADE